MILFSVSIQSKLEFNLFAELFDSENIRWKNGMHFSEFIPRHEDYPFTVHVNSNFNIFSLRNKKYLTFNRYFPSTKTIHYAEALSKIGSMETIFRYLIENIDCNRACNIKHIADIERHCHDSINMLIERVETLEQKDDITEPNTTEKKGTK